MTTGGIVKFSDLFTPTPKQREALATLDAHQYTLFGGAAGGGKSHLMRWTGVRQLMLAASKFGVHGARAMICCETYPALKDRQLSKILTEFPRELGTWHSTDREFVLAPQYGGGYLCFRNLDDASKYASSEWMFIGWDECTLVGNEQVFLDLMKRLRYPPIPSEWCKMLLGTNPTGPGLGWVKKRWIDRIWDEDEDVNPNDYAFVQSFATDNPYIDEAYLRRLQSLPKDQREALLNGSWSSFEGQFFTEWNAGVHTIAPIQIPQGQGTYYGCLDWGYDAPSAYYLNWLSPKGELHTIRELYQRHLAPSQLAKEIKATNGDIRPSIILADPSIWTKHPETGRSIADVLAGEGVHCIPGNNERVLGWARMREWLRVYEVEENGVLKKTARWKVWSTCPNLIRTLPNLVYDKTKTDDCNSDGEDHGPDANRYLQMHLPEPDALGKVASRRSKEKRMDDELLFRITNGLVIPDSVSDGKDWSSGW